MREFTHGVDCHQHNVLVLSIINKTVLFQVMRWATARAEIPIYSSFHCTRRVGHGQLYFPAWISNSHQASLLVSFPELPVFSLYGLNCLLPFSVRKRWGYIVILFSILLHWAARCASDRYSLCSCPFQCGPNSASLSYPHNAKHETTSPVCTAKWLIEIVCTHKFVLRVYTLSHLQWRYCYASWLWAIKFCGILIQALKWYPTHIVAKVLGASISPSLPDSWENNWPFVCKLHWLAPGQAVYVVCTWN